MSRIGYRPLRGDVYSKIASLDKRYSSGPWYARVNEPDPDHPYLVITQQEPGLSSKTWFIATFTPWSHSLANGRFAASERRQQEVIANAQLCAMGPELVEEVLRLRARVEELEAALQLQGFVVPQIVEKQS